MCALTKNYWIHALSPLHVGVGEGVGSVDLPIMREKVTNWPIIPGSSIKGVLRDYFENSKNNNHRDNIKIAFGCSDDSDSPDALANAGSLVFTDSHIVCFPVRSLYGTFAWVSSPMVLGRLKRNIVSSTINGIPALLNPEEQSVNIGSTDESVLLDPAEKKKVYFEDIDLTFNPCDLTKAWGRLLAGYVFADDSEWQKLFIERFAVVSDNTFNFICDTATEINARIRIDSERKIVKSGALWYEESLPAESILSGLVWCDKVYPNNAIKPHDLLDLYCKQMLELQIGGKATIGKGQTRLVFSDGGAIND